MKKLLKPSKPKPTENPHLWLCEFGRCKKIATVSYQPSFRLDLYCEEHAAVKYAADLKRHNREKAS